MHWRLRDAIGAIVGNRHLEVALRLGGAREIGELLLQTRQGHRTNLGERPLQNRRHFKKGMGSDKRACCRIDFMASPAGAHVALALRRHSSLRLARMVTTMLRSSGWSGLVVLSTLASPSWWSADCAASMVAATSFMAAGEPMAISDGCMPICLNWAVGGAMPLATGITVGTSVRTDMSRKKGECVWGDLCLAERVRYTFSS